MKQNQVHQTHEPSPQTNQTPTKPPEHKEPWGWQRPGPPRCPVRIMGPMMLSALRHSSSSVVRVGANECTKYLALFQNTALIWHESRTNGIFATLIPYYTNFSSLIIATLFIPTWGLLCRKHNERGAYNKWHHTGIIALRREIWNQEALPHSLYILWGGGGWIWKL